jgi:hypothetical protein
MHLGCTCWFLELEWNGGGNFLATSMTIPIRGFLITDPNLDAANEAQRLIDH